nr:hypothetical protein Iba_chr13cCG11190 [Ipomoea batatas]
MKSGNLDPNPFPAKLRYLSRGKLLTLDQSGASKLDSDHELSEEDINKLLFHWRRASASVLVDADDAKKQGFGAIVKNRDDPFVAARSGTCACTLDPYHAKLWAIKEALVMDQTPKLEQGDHTIRLYI